jgi:uncharacterized protein
VADTAAFSSVPIIDAWVNARSADAVKTWQETRLLREAAEARGVKTVRERGLDDILAEIDKAGVDIAIVSGMAGDDPVIPQRNYPIETVLGWCHAHHARLRAAITIEGLGRISSICRTIETVVSDPAFVMVRVIPMFLQEPINSPRLYPVYERCEALSVPVSINVGVPGPRARAALQDPLLLDDVLIDFPHLTIVGAHMGSPWEPLLIRLMRKYERLYLSNSAWLATYLHPDVVAFMGSSLGARRLIFASDSPFMSPARALAAARELPVSAESLAAFIGGNAVRALGLLPDGGLERCR